MGGVKPLSEKEWGEFELGTLFNIYTGGDLILSNTRIGDVPVISHSITNNGIATWTESMAGKKIFDSNQTISLADRGNFYAHVQKTNFYIGTRVKALQAKFKTCNREILSFICPMINKQSVKFSYGNNATSGTDKIRIMLPTNKNSEPDYEYMENFMKQMEYQKLQTYLKFKS